MAPAVASARSCSHTAGPACPSVLRLCCDSKAMMAPRVISLGVPAVHRLWSDAGSPQRQVNEPSWAWAASCSAGNAPAGVKLTGRYPSWARSCCNRRVLPPATVNLTDNGWANRLPAALTTPVSPAGIEIVSDDNGANGAKATKVKVSGVTTCQVPATEGLREGEGEWGSRGTEKCTDTVASVGTPVLPSAGPTDATLRGPGLAAAS